MESISEPLSEPPAEEGNDQDVSTTPAVDPVSEDDFEDAPEDDEAA